jgi:hypothetical protein
MGDKHRHRPNKIVSGFTIHKEQTIMPQAIFVSELELNPGTGGEEMKAFFVEEYLLNINKLPGWASTLHVRNHGQRPGQYL